MQSYPNWAANRARPMPVLPPVASMITGRGELDESDEADSDAAADGDARRSFSTAAMRYFAVRSLMLPPGFRYSILARIRHPVASDRDWSSMRGVLPIAAEMEGRISGELVESTIGDEDDDDDGSVFDDGVLSADRR